MATSHAVPAANEMRVIVFPGNMIGASSTLPDYPELEWSTIPAAPFGTGYRDAPAVSLHKPKHSREAHKLFSAIVWYSHKRNAWRAQDDNLTNVRALLG